MSSIVVQEFITLDGVIQGPGGDDEDRENGFAHGGWQDRYVVEAAVDDLVRQWESRTETLLLGRKTYDIWAGAWAVWDEDAPGFMGELTRRYNRVPKYVASRTLTAPTWRNTHVLVPDVASAVAELRARPMGGESGDASEIRVWGSSGLVRTLAEHDLVDEYRLVVYPIVLGSGKRLFADGFPLTLFDVADTQTFGSGVSVITYRRRGSRAPESGGDKHPARA